MKASTLNVYFYSLLAAVLTLNGCGNAGVPSQRDPSATNNGISPRSMRAGSGQLQVGQFWWVWKTVSAYLLTDVLVECPQGYVPTGGGFVLKGNTAHSVSQQVFSSLPAIVSVPGASSRAFWEVVAVSSFKKPLEAWAICAKET